MSDPRQTFAVDVGGTFTDLVLLDRATGEVTFAKAPTTPERPWEGILTAIDSSGVSLPAAETFFHGTTRGLNALLERKGAAVGLITTQGFRDILEMRDSTWPLFSHWFDPPEAYVPRRLRREVPGRLSADGIEAAPLDEDAVLREAAYLLDAGCEAIAVCFVHAYAHPAHELRARELIAEAFPGVSVTLSHDVSHEYREYERTATTVGDAAIKPLMGSYIATIEQALEARGFAGSFVLTRCDGGVMSAREARARPIRTLTSGPASGVMGTVQLSRWLGLPRLIGCDMGGTSFDASLVIDHEPALAASTRIADMPLLVPVVELATIGAGGGSIASVDAGGALVVGPRSAGAEPGPACYGKGGTLPTFTDAALVSGLLDADGFLGGDIPLDVDAAREAIRVHVAEPLGVPVDEAAAGIVALTEAKMAATLEALTVEKGHDPREFSLLAFGGGGSLVASALRRRLGMTSVVVPRFPGAFSAWGMLTLDTVFDFSRTLPTRLDELSGSLIAERLAELERAGAEALAGEGVPEERRTLLRSVDMRYASQEHVLTVQVPEEALAAGGDLAPLRERFDARHEQAYGYRLDGAVELTAYRLRAVGTRDKPEQPLLARGDASAMHARTGTRLAVHRESGGAFEWAVYDRDTLLAGNRIAGPAIVEERAATTLVGSDEELVVDDLGNLVITPLPTAPAAMGTAAGAALDPVTFAVLRNSLLAVADTAATAFKRTSMHPIVYDAHDFAISLYDEQMRVIAETAFQGLFSGTLETAVPACVDAIGRERLGPGDVVITNLPRLQGIHPADGVAVQPVFHDDELVGFVALRSHMGDVGGASFMPTVTTEVVQEGLLVPPVKLIDGGRRNEAVAGIIAANSRTPGMTLGNWLAGVAAMNAGAEAFAGLVAQHGVRTYRQVVDAVLDHGERMARAAIGRMADGTYTADAILDTNGIEHDVPVPLHAEVTVAGERLTIDLTGSAPQQRAPINSPYPTTLALARLVLKTLATPDIPANAGEFRTLDVIAEPGSIFDPEPHLPSFWAHRAAATIVEAIMAAMAPALPGAPALGGADVAAAHSLHPHPGGWLCFTINICMPGRGAREGHDGASAMMPRIGSAVKSISIELIETRDPLLTHRYELDRDSGGPGRWRGGLAITREVEHLTDGLGFYASYMTSGSSPMDGIAGGLPPRRPCGIMLLRGDEVVIGPPDCVQADVPLRAGDRTLSWSTGGSGYGDPLERDAELVARDVLDEYVSAESALADYGVVLGADGAVDVEATAACRAGRGALARPTGR